MAMSINTNVLSLTTQRNLTANQSTLVTSAQRLSSGMRVNTAKDDSAAIAVASRMETQVRGLNAAARNLSDAISFVQTVEGAIGKVSAMFQRMRELSVQAANATNNDDDRGNLNAEYQQLALEITRTLENTTYNGEQVFFDGATQAERTVTYQFGANPDDQVDLIFPRFRNVPYMSSVTNSVISTVADSTTAIGTLDHAITAVTTRRARLGALLNRLETIIDVQQINSENTSAAKGRIVDANFAQEASSLSRSQILQQAASAVAAQANSQPQQVLRLLR